ncbi:hypothetical protein QBC37DRAFT_485879 [Rhypophila decipiens]|uniref:Uncharacterized protein n=1 Tax=Rhypophila decipiens TaxID=261697 RepID=A0AAN7B1Y2_9PEZI|nr:hypothetical protein QBC37DRAFT_485879 [Rhypophila decipiens]
MHRAPRSSTSRSCQSPFYSFPVFEASSPGREQWRFSDLATPQQQHHEVGNYAPEQGDKVPREQTLRKLGAYHTFVLFAGTLANVGCGILLAFLWFSNEANQIWRTIVAHNWATRYVAITSLVIRIVTSAQSVQCVSMLSSLVLEEFETPLASVAAISVLSMQQPERMIGYTHQFAGQLMQRRGFLARDPIFSTFVEYTEPPSSFAEGLFDTGTTIRGFIPFDDRLQREKVDRYSGMATLYDHRVVCVRLSENLTHLDVTFGIRDTDIVVPQFNGTTGGSFHCGGIFLTQWKMEDPDVEWMMGLCLLDGDGGLISTMQGTPLSPWYETVSAATGGEKYLVVNMPSITSEQELPHPTKHKVTYTGTDGEWLHFRAESPFDTFALSLSLCYTAGAGQHRGVDAVRPSGRPTEPKAAWKPDPFPNSYLSTAMGGWYDTRSIREQLDAVPGNLPLTSQNIFTLTDPPKSWISFAPNSTYTGQGPVVEAGSALVLEMFYNAEDKFQPERSLCFTCGESGFIHPVYAVIVNEIIRETWHPGLGIQALLTFLWAQKYYAEAYKFSEFANGTYWTTVTVLAPVQRLSSCSSWGPWPLK